MPRDTQISYLTDPNRSQDTSLGFSGTDELAIEGKPINGPQLPLFSFRFIEQITDNFANKNKIGQGGFGPVHKVNFYVICKHLFCRVMSTYVMTFCSLFYFIGSLTWWRRSSC